MNYIISTVGSWWKNWQIEVHLHRECYVNSENWQKKLGKCFNLAILSPMFYYMVCKHNHEINNHIDLLPMQSPCISQHKDMLSYAISLINKIA